MSAGRRAERQRPPGGGGRSGRPSTLLQVAARAGVSKSTAAIVLSGRAAACRISAPCVERVRAAALAIGYQGNYHARTLATGKASTFGLTMVGGDHGGVGSSFWGAIADGVEGAARANGYDLLLLGGKGGDAAIAHAASRLESRRIDALIVLRLLFYRLPGELLRSPLPVVTIGGRTSEPFPDVQLDAEPGIAAAVAHLAELGHRSVLWIALARDGRVVLPERRKAFRAAARRHRMQVHEAEFAELDGHDRRPDEVVARFQELLGPLVLPAGVTAAFCYNDLMALALQGVLSARGFRLPRDLSIIGFDDLYAALGSPPLSTISHGLPDLGAAAVGIAMTLVGGGRPPPLTLVPARFVARASTSVPLDVPARPAHPDQGDRDRTG
jgi:DNA-binding LacI/PurR family transcriptional regulator